MILEKHDVPALVHSRNFVGATLLVGYVDGSQVVGEVSTATLMNTDLVEIVWTTHKEHGGERLCEDLILDQWATSIVGHVVFFMRNQVLLSGADPLVSLVSFSMEVSHNKRRGIPPRAISFTLFLDK